MRNEKKRSQRSLTVCLLVCLITTHVMLSRPVAAETSLTSLRHQVSEQLKVAATTQSGAEQDDSIASLCDLYVVLRSDPRYETSEMLKGTAMKVRRRLLTVSRKREIRLNREGVERPPAIAQSVDEALRESLSKASGEHGETIVSKTQGAAAAGGIANGGWELVELIQRVVSPDFWEPQGGAGSMRYFAMRRVLVVRATSDVHQKVKDLLMALR